MNGKAKSNSVVTTRLDEEGFLEISVIGSGVVKFDVDKVSAACRAKAEMHGWTQRLVDAAAMSRLESGKPASPADKYEAIKELADYYMGGTEEWARRGAGGGTQSITLQAISRVKGVTYTQAEEFVGRYATAHYKGDTKAALAFLRSGETVGKAILAIRAENQPAPVLDADKALNDLT